MAVMQCSRVHKRHVERYKNWLLL